MKQRFLFASAGRRGLTVAILAIVATGGVGSGAALGASPQAVASAKPRFSEAIAFDVSAPLRDKSASALLRVPPGTVTQAGANQEPLEVRPERGPVVKDKGFSGDGALKGASSSALVRALTAATLTPLVNFEGISNQDNFNLFGCRVNPPDPVGDVGPEPLRRDGQPRLRGVLQDRATCCSARSTRARSGPASRSRTAPTPPATRSSSTTSSRTAGC